MRAPLRARFKDLPTSDMKEILLQRMLEENYDKVHEDHKMAYEALQKSILRDENELFDADKAEKPKKMKRKQDSPKTPPGSPPPPPPPPPPSGPSGASGTTGASDSAQDPLPPPSSTTTNQGDPSQGSHAPGSSKTAASTTYTAWTTTTFRFEPSASSIPEDVFMHEESDVEAQDLMSDDEDISSRHIPKVNLNQEWFKPISEEERHATPEPACYAPPPENSLLSQTGDIGGLIDWFCKKQGITELTTEHLEGPAYEVVKAFHPDVIHLQFQMEECHKLLTNQVDDGLLRHNVSRPLPLGGPPGQVTIQTEFFFNKDLKYLRFGNKGDRLALSITKIKAAHYLNAGLEQMVPDQMWIEEECMHDISATYGVSHWWFKRQKFYIDRHSADTNRRAIVRTHMRILSVVRIEVFSIYGYDYMKKIILRRADNQEYTIAENDFKDLYPSDFEDLYLLNLQGIWLSKKGRRLPARHQELPDSAEPRQTSLGSYRSRVHTRLQDSLLFKSRTVQRQVCASSSCFPFRSGSSSGESSGTWKALLVKEYEKETTDFYGEPNDDIFSVASSNSCVSYKDGKVRYEFPRSCQSQRDLPRDNSLVSVEVLRYDYKRSNVNKGIVRTEMELVLEHTQQGLHKDGDADASFHFRNSDKYYHDPEECLTAPAMTAEFSALALGTTI
ncbi:hypothetical protein Tco_0882872 [Tanacetum coccineum]